MAQEERQKDCLLLLLLLDFVVFVRFYSEVVGLQKLVNVDVYNDMTY